MTAQLDLDLAVVYACALALYGWLLAWVLSLALAATQRLITSRRAERAHAGHASTGARPRGLGAGSPTAG
jgi:ABC-type bacteriocin/lantibiotic exporter with double-glycine peptidase domain